MSSERTKRRRIREEVDFILYETENLHGTPIDVDNTNFENNTVLDSFEDAVQLPNISTQLVINTPEILSVQNDINSDINNDCHDDHLPVV